MIGILMAAGLGTRMYPLTQKTPKPLVKVKGVPMVETIIEKLNNKVSHIYIVVGYKHEQFEYLVSKYSNISLIENKEYQTVNNISSIHAAQDVLGTDDCFICEADLYISDPNFFDIKLDTSGYFGKYIKGHSDDWVFDLNEDGIITRVGKKGDDAYNMCGVAWFKAKEAQVLKDSINEAYKHPGTYENLFWDDIVNLKLKELQLKVYPVMENQIIEIDSVKELEEIDPKYKEYN